MESVLLYRSLLQAQMDKLVFEKLGILKSEFPVKQLESDPSINKETVFDAANLIIEVMENSAQKFFVEMRQRVEIERNKMRSRR